jgi:regulator of sigma E protease
MSIIIFFAVLFVLVLVHEWGHFIAARKTGMRVDEFAIGFPPRLFSVKKGETEYSFNALPIGGYVRIFGENPDEEMSEADRPRAFGSRPKWAQAVVLVAGVTMNVIFAWMLFFTTLLIGTPAAVDENLAGSEAKLYISDVIEESPLIGQVVPGAIVTSLSTNNTLLNNPTPSSFTQFIQDSNGSPVTITYELKDETKSVEVLPKKGIIASDAERYAVGVALAYVEIKSATVPEAITGATSATYNGLIAITVGLTSLIIDAVSGTADFSEVAGPVGIVGMVGDAATIGLTALLTFTAMISLNLAVINMLPIPALDGGRLLFVGIEAIIRRPINPIWMGRVNLVGFALLMILMIVVTWNDIAKLF